MKKMGSLVLLLICFVFYCNFIFGQAPNIIFQKCFGGSNGDKFYRFEVTEDSSFIFGGITSSWDGDVTGHHANSDVWLVKTDALFNLKWARCYGGYESDYFTYPLIIDDSNYYVIAYTESNDGDVTVQYGNGDIWLIKTDTAGTMVWQKSYGGSYGDLMFDQHLIQGKLFGIGSTLSNNWDVSGQIGNGDVWMTVIDTSSNLLFQKCLGGSQGEHGRSIIPLSNNRLFVSAVSGSDDHDLTNNYGSADYWALVVDTSGNILWQLSYGGGGMDLNYSATVSTDGGFVLAGITYSNDHDVSGNHGDADIWVIKIDSTGNLQWQRCLGGSQQDLCYHISNTSDGGYLLAGYTWSNDGDITLNRGLSDAWIIKLDSTGNIVWQKTIGGSDGDDASMAKEMDNGTIVVVGYTGSNDWDVSGNHGGGDAWVVVLDSLASGVTEPIEAGHSLTVYPNPANESFRVGGLKSNAPTHIDAYDAYGSPVYEIKIDDEHQPVVTVNGWHNGLYLIKITIPGSAPVVRKLLVAH